MSTRSKARDGAPSRRGLIQGATACAVALVPPAPGSDPALRVARQWCALEIEQEALTRAWQDQEAWLFAHHNWPRLSEAERCAAPVGARLRAIEARLQEINETYEALLPELTTTPATTREGLFARFDALLWFLDSYDQPDAHALLVSCQRDLQRLWA